ncbi:uncharacterized protein J8A68_004055 [[Candida] subhashii]|uniref:Mitochondrial outer membrane protein OM14 C-terminal domain-containing protein n=1 Tax=[Candida] subhashii TaxID=561895 RepID=A0A8J5QKW1_9ASCO|nr:uncharacterized protein J8A68_004055 [[Candida] subhashii]KAG7662407.1 hypothetical protein J8A68_004055 [[Candida] subhashii]
MSEHIPTAEEIKKDVNEVVDESVDKVSESKDEGKSVCKKVVANIKGAFSAVANAFCSAGAKVQSTTCSTVSRVGTELSNPVVAAQVVVVAGGAAAGYLAYVERNRLNTDNKVFVCVNASIITGLVVLDGFLFNKYYPKYDKKQK